MWVPFNEGWGQYDTERITDLVKSLDPHRLVNNASGWVDRKVGDVHDVHAYPGPAMAEPEDRRASVLGEFGGLGLPLKDHLWQADKNWGYRKFETIEGLNKRYLKLIMDLHPLIGMGLSAAVYTQTTDVEGEVNGFMTYDREVIKVDEMILKPLHDHLYVTAPTITTVIPTSRKEKREWRYTLISPAPGWTEKDFDDSSWEKGFGGFGKKGTPGAHINTPWETSDIWIRTTFDLDTSLKNPHLMIHHDEDAEVYINGTLAAKLTKFTMNYKLYPLSEAAKNLLVKGGNIIAVHCHQTGGGQFIDLGVQDLIRDD